MTAIEEFALEGMQMIRQGKDESLAREKLTSMYYQIRTDPSSLKDVTMHQLVGRAILMFLSYGTVDDIDIVQMLSSIAYLMFSEALRTSDDINLHKDRLSIIMFNREAFGYTVSSVVNKGVDMFSMSMMMSGFRKRDSMVKMEMADFSAGGRALICFDKVFRDEFMQIMERVDGGTYGDNIDLDEFVAEGTRLHQEVHGYLRGKVFDDVDIDF